LSKNCERYKEQIITFPEHGEVGTVVATGQLAADEANANAQRIC